MSRTLRPLTKEVTVRVAYAQSDEEAAWSQAVRQKKTPVTVARVLAAMEALSATLTDDDIDHRIEVRVEGDRRPHVYDYRRTK